MKKYHPPMSLVPDISDAKTFMSLPEIKNLEDEIDFLVTGIPWDEGVSNRSGASAAPRKVRKISTSLRPVNTYHNLNIFDYLSGVDYGDMPTYSGDVGNTIEKISNEFEKIAKNEITTFTIGGDHSVTYPELNGLARVHGPMALIHFDAHFDNMDKVEGKKYTHASFVIRALEDKLIDPEKSIQVGIRGSNYATYEERKMGLELISMEKFDDMGVDWTNHEIRKRVGDSKCFISLDIDGISPAFAPGTGTPEPGGFTDREMIKLVRKLSGINLVGADLVEVSPEFDHADITSYLASTLLHEMISLKAVYEKNKL